VGLALELENIAAETYVKDTTLVKSTSNKALFASIMGIEAQHVAVLLAVQALLKAGAPQLISLSPGTAARPCRPWPAASDSPMPSTRPTVPPRPSKEPSSEQAKQDEESPSVFAGSESELNP
jgi:hypothetical protein